MHLVVGLDPDGNMHVLDLWRRQADSAEWIEALVDLVVKWRPREWAEEGRQIRAALGPMIEVATRQRGAYVYRRQFSTRGDKAVRARSVCARMSMRGLFIPADTLWRQDLEAELLRFPAGVHDDICDALGLIGQLLDHISVPAQPKAPEGPTDRYARRRREAATGSGWAA